MTTEEVKKLSDEELRVKVAELDGWTKYRVPNIWRKGSGLSSVENLPDYSHDLNAVHEVEKKLTFSQRQEYYEALGQLNSPGGLRVADTVLIHATARHRCEALVLTLL